ncbi:glycosyltransferase [Vagococcus carniphilus]|uniref:glycosyltransferase n=1 Tax=Vagococcus carniphilus TaxID=218144 RepID=UPI003BA9BA96
MKKKILIITTIKAPYRMDLFEELGNFFDLTVFFEQKNEITRNEKWMSSEIINFTSIYSKKWDKSLAIPKIDLIKLLKMNTFDLVIFYEYSTPTALLGMQYCIVKRIPYLINNDGAFLKRDFIFKYLLKKHFVTNANGLLANGNSAVHYYLYYGAKIEQVNLHHFTSLKDADYEKKEMEKSGLLKKKLSIPKDANVYITVGRFIELKRIDFLINLWRKLPDNYILYIIGEGKLKKYYTDLINKYDLVNVKIIDFLSKEELFEYYEVSNALLFPSNNEVWGLVVQEALSRGVPVIGTVKSNAISEMIKNNENGFICRLDEDEWLSKIKYLEGNNLLKTKIEKDNLLSGKKYTVEYQVIEIKNFIELIIKSTGAL